MFLSRNKKRKGIMFNTDLFSQKLYSHMAGASFRDVGRATGISHTAVWKCAQKENNPSVDHFLKLCAWMRIKPETFYTN